MDWKRILIGRWSWKRPFISLASIYLILLMIALFFADRIIFLPPAPSYDSELAGLAFTETPEGEKIAFVHLPAAPGKNTLLFSHGNAEDIGQYLPVFEELNRRGLGVLAYDYPGYGLSSGTASEASCYRAVDAVWKEISERNIAPGNIVIFGRSVGSGPSIYLAESHPEVKAVLLMSPFKSTFTTAIPLPFAIFPRDRFPNLKRIRNIRLPLLVIHGAEDEVIPVSHGEALVEASPASSKNFFPIQGGGHNDLFEIAGDEIINHIVEFVER